ncbi:alpha/beta hydrolase [Dyadobacter sp. LHD-138]|uniref:alpha/beta hydrolase n=1 Tax=Dyadobacter sp. LHD-138 TaxID=3071413 RepID=UPI0027DFFEF7|nr:alpha/beta hydrolase [Dyadobacter sp. LHD-138]MDQ6480961.1 alpha/beta hydrolase [Dyadobacter sp. LHD-138]
MKFSIFSLLLITGMSVSLSCFAQKEMPLYPGKIPNSTSAANEETTVKGVVRNVSKPTLSVFLPEAGTANGASVIICPGGGYGVLVIEREGFEVARAFNKMGITAFVLKYRLPSDKTLEDKSIGPLQDAQQAIKTVRERAREWKLDVSKIGIMGFSAGGHLASTAGTHFSDPLIENKSGTSLRPDFMILIYPVISFLDAQGHKGSRANLIGQSPTEEKIKYFSSELQVQQSTPPTFLTHAGDDTVVPVPNSLMFYEALNKNKIPADLHLYSKGEHGYLKTPTFDVWFGQCLNWMKTNQFIP